MAGSRLPYQHVLVKEVGATHGRSFHTWIGHL
jgi:hypothetical protein